MGAKDFDGIDEHFTDELRERLSQNAYKELVPALQCVTRPNFRWKVEREREENEAEQIGFSASQTGDSTCCPKDSKEGYLYRTDYCVS